MFGVNALLENLVFLVIAIILSCAMWYVAKTVNWNWYYKSDVKGVVESSEKITNRRINGLEFIINNIATDQVLMRQQIQKLEVECGK